MADPKQPAFPRTGEGFGNPKYDAPGMTLRDWFAGQALSGIASCLSGKGDVLYNVIVSDAYDLADAMLAEKDRRDAE